MVVTSCIEKNIRDKERGVSASDIVSCVRSPIGRGTRFRSWVLGVRVPSGVFRDKINKEVIMIKRGAFLREKMRYFLIHGVLKYTFIITCGLAGGYIAFNLMKLF